MSIVLLTGQFVSLFIYAVFRPVLWRITTACNLSYLETFCRARGGVVMVWLTAGTCCIRLYSRNPTRRNSAYPRKQNPFCYSGSFCHPVRNPQTLGNQEQIFPNHQMILARALYFSVILCGLSLYLNNMKKACVGFVCLPRRYLTALLPM